MAHISDSHLANWLALYAATGACCAIAAVLAGLFLCIDLYRERFWTNLDSPWAIVRSVPQSWWRWQKLYLLSTPVTLAIVAAFALTLDWAAA